MSIKAQIDGKKFDVKDIATMEMFIVEDRARLNNISASIRTYQYSNDHDVVIGLQKDQLKLRERIRITEALLTLVKG